MAVNRSSALRTDLPFLTRRVKPRPAAPAAPAAPQGTTTASGAPSLPHPGAPAQPSVPSPQPSAPPASAPVSPPRTTSGPAAPSPGSLTLSPPPRETPAPTVTTSLSLGHTAPPAASPASSAASATPSAHSLSARSPSAGASLPNLSASNSPSNGPQRPAPLYSKLFPAPGMNEVRTLDKRNPVVRLTPMESAVGSLAVAGSMRAVWESDRFLTGSVSSGELRPENLLGTMVTTPGNRPVVGYEDELALIPLRRVGMLRRALFFPKPKQPMSVGIYNGRSLSIPAKAGERSFYVLSVMRIGTVLELRAEVIPYGMELKAIWEAFGFTMSTEFPFQGN